MPPRHASPLLPARQSTYQRYPVACDATLGLLLAGTGCWLLHYLRLYSGLALTKPALTAAADQLCSASLAMASFQFTALALLVSLGDSHRTKLTNEQLSSQAQTAAAQASNQFESFFTSNAYLWGTGALLTAIAELFSVFGLLILLKFLWFILPDWLCQATLLFSFPLLGAPVFRSVRLVG